MASFTTTVEPTAAPVTVAEVKQQFKYLETAEDGLLTLYVNAAVDYLEGWLRRAFMVRTIMLRMDSFDDLILPALARPDEIRLPMPPAAAVSAFVYDDADGDEVDFSASIQTDLYSKPARIWPVAGTAWPATQVDCLNTVRITYTAGHATAAAVPEQYKQCLRWMVALWWRNREPASPVDLRDVPHTVTDFVRQLRLTRIG